MAARGWQKVGGRAHMRRTVSLIAATVFASGVANAWQQPATVPPPQSQPALLPAPLQSPAPAAAKPAVPTAAAQQVAEQIQSFQPGDVRLQWTDRRWQLVANNEVIKDFGPREQEARQALRIIQDLKLNQHAVLGSPQPVMEYWLVDGKPPQGRLGTAMRPVTMNPAELRVEQVRGQWCLRDNSRILFNFGQQSAEAKQALAIVRKYDFDQVGVVGALSPSMYVFTTHREGEKPALQTSKVAHSSTRQMHTPTFSRLAKNSDGTPRTEPMKKAGAPAGLEGVSRTVVPPLRIAAQASTQEKPREPSWQAQPQATASIAPPTNAERVAFDWRRVQIRQDADGWKLFAGSQVLANFGPQQHEAKLALQAMRHYRFSEQLRVGGQEGNLNYYVVNAQAPRGVMFGMAGEHLNLEQLEVRQVPTGYAICEGERVVVRLRDRQEDGAKLLDTMKRNQCDRLCRIGEPEKDGMLLLLRSK